MKPATKVLAGPRVDVVRGSDLLEDAVAQDRDPVAHRHRLDLVVGHIDGRRADLALEPPDLAARLGAELRVEVRERLVHQERLRVADERPSERDALPLAARQLPWLAFEQRPDSEHVRRPLHAPVDLRAAELADPQAESEVLADAHLRVERVVLEDHRDVALARRDVVDDALADADVAGRERLEAREQAERRRLPRPRGPDEHHELAVGDLERQLGHGHCRAEGPRRALGRR